MPPRPEPMCSVCGAWDNERCGLEGDARATRCPRFTTETRAGDALMLFSIVLLIAAIGIAVWLATR